MKKPKNPKKKQAVTAGHAAPLRKLLRSLYSLWVTSQSDREELARFLGQSVTSLSNLAKGEGSLNTWWAVILWHFKIPPHEADKMAATILGSLRDIEPLNEADRLWHQLDDVLDQSRKLYWVKLIKVAAEIERDLADERTNRTKTTAKD